MDKDFSLIIVYLISLILSITVHEFGHAIVADKLGDRLPRNQGRVTLNPLAHIDPLGTVAIPVMVALTGFPLLGWGRPVVTNPLAYSRRMPMKTGHMLVAAAGPAMNLLFALVISIVFVLLLRTGVLSPVSPIVRNTVDLIRLNIVLMFFNLLPFPPLDGGTVLEGLLPDKYAKYMRPLHQYGWFILMALLFTGLLTIFLAPAMLFFSAWIKVIERLVA